MSYLFKNYLRANIEFIKANGNELIDQTGRSYIDFHQNWRNQFRI